MEEYWNSIASVLGITLKEDDRENLKILELLETYKIPFKLSSSEKRILIEFIDCLGEQFEEFFNNSYKILNFIELDNHNDCSGGNKIFRGSTVSHFSGLVETYFEIHITSKKSGKIFVTSSFFGEFFRGKEIDIRKFTPDTYNAFIRILRRDNHNNSILYKCYRRGYIKYFNPELHNKITEYFLNKKERN